MDVTSCYSTCMLHHKHARSNELFTYCGCSIKLSLGAKLIYCRTTFWTGLFIWILCCPNFLLKRKNTDDAFCTTIFQSKGRRESYAFIFNPARKNSIPEFDRPFLANVGVTVLFVGHLSDQRKIVIIHSSWVDYMS